LGKVLIFWRCILFLVKFWNLINALSMNEKRLIETMQEVHWDSVRDIYRQGIETGMATLETDAGTWDKWNSSHLTEPRLVVILNERVVGWAALSPVSGRCVYGGVAEISVYIDADYRGRGIGLQLLNELVKLSENNGIWTLQAGIFAENKSSIRLHEKAGFRIVGVREKLGKLHGIWKDIVLMERRSTIAGIH
jgi:L-amino acid N-acyltransferase YncA